MNTTMGMERVLEWLLARSWQAAVLVGCVLLLQWLLRRQLTNRWRSALWWVVLARLVLPVGPESACSLFNCFRTVPAAVVVTPPANTAPMAVVAPPRVTLAAPASLASVPAAEHNPMAERIGAPPIRGGVSTAVGLPARMSTREMIWLGVGSGWLVGVIILGTCVAFQVGRFKRQLARTATPADPRLREILARCQRESGVRRAIELWETEVVTSPALFGVFQLRLLLPRGIGERFDGEELRFIFLHELAHVRRGDLWLNWLVTILQVAHWFNPVIWLGFARLRADRELACDELALRQTGEAAAAAYGSTIIKLLEGWQRPAAMPGLVGILEDKQQMRRRILRIVAFKRVSRWSALAALVVVALGVVALTDAETGGAAGKPYDLTGLVEDQSGKPIRATVFIDTARPKVGTSMSCPSCYADCRKSEKADADGHFKIESLDPELIFTILAAAPGCQPEYVSKVDPTNGPVRIQLKPIELASAPPENCVHGRVVDGKGQSVAGAAVEAYGLHFRGGGGVWGALDGVDPLAVTDEKGEFVITSRKPFEQLDVKVEARAFAKKSFLELASGNEVHELKLGEGASVTGRVMRNGKPLANVTVGMVSVDRQPENFTGDFVIGTAADGRFTFANLPADVDYYIYGKMDLLTPYGAIPIQKLHSGKDGAVTDAGDLVVSSGHRLAGRVVLSDGQMLPPQTRLFIGRQGAWDSLQVRLPSDGRFSVSNLPTETYSVSVQFKGYRISAQNGSLDTLNPFQLVGQVNGDITNLVVLLEPGENLPSKMYDGSDGDSPAHRPLEGAGVKKSSERVPGWVVSGGVTDRSTGKPIRQFRVIPGTEIVTWGQISWKDGSVVAGSNGAYTIDLDKRWPQPVIKVEAEGYLPTCVVVTPRDQSNLDLRLDQGRGPSGVIMGPNGQPAGDADVLLICAEVDQPSVSYGLHLDTRLRRDLAAKTDAEGHFAYGPELGMESVAAISPAGFAQVAVTALVTNPIIHLAAYGEIKGVLWRDGQPGTNEDLDFAIIGAAGSTNRVIGFNNSGHTDASGRFQFQHVPPGELQLTYRVAVGNNGWESQALQKVMVKPGETVDLEIKAGTRESARQWIGGGPRPPVRVPGGEIKGTILLPNGQPASDKGVLGFNWNLGKPPQAPTGQPAAQVAVGVVMKEHGIQLGRAELVSYEAWNDGRIVRTDAAGNFTLPLFEGVQFVMAASEQGFARVTPEELKQKPQITLQAWGQINGTLRLGNRPGAGQKVYLHDWPPPFDKYVVAPLDFDRNAYLVKTDDQGRFVFPYVPPGDHFIARDVPTGGGGSVSEELGTVKVASGEVRSVDLVDHGRTVVGKLAVAGANGSQDWQKGRNFWGALLTPPSELMSRIQQAKTEDERKVLFRSPAYREEIVNFGQRMVNVSPDGLFRADAVLPGTYELSIQVPDFRAMPGLTQPTNPATNLMSIKEIVVPEASETNDAPLDEGTVELKSGEPPMYWVPAIGHLMVAPKGENDDEAPMY